MLLEVQTTIFALVLMIVILFNFFKDAKWIRSKNKYFIGLMISTMLILIILILLNVFKGHSDGLYSIIFTFLVTCYYINMVIILVFWFLYLHFHIHQNEVLSKRVFLLISPVVVIFTLLVIIAVYIIPESFGIEINGEIDRGELYYTAVTLLLFYIFIYTFYTFIHRRKLPRRDYFTLIMFTIPPIVTGVLQFFQPELFLVFESLSISVLFVFINIQSKITSIDSLTGISNRREFDKQISYISNLKKIDFSLWAMIIDIDDFKKINDIHSHQAGDLVLKDVSKILKKSLRKDDFVARIGGDEFCIIVESCDDNGTLDILKRIEHNLKEYNNSRSELFKIDISIGYGYYDPEKYENFMDFLEELDRKMYVQKNNSKKQFKKANQLKKAIS